MDIFRLLSFLLASAFGWLAWYLFKSIQEGQGRKSQKANPLLACRLVELLNGDTAIARRLLRNINRTNPGRSVDWCLEKAIFDLERDRH
jgi:hypothetical protein